MTPADIKEARRKMGLSVADLARLLDTDPQTVRRMEQSATASTFRSPAPRMVRLIALYLVLHKAAPQFLPKDWPKGEK